MTPPRYDRIGHSKWCTQPQDTDKAKLDKQKVARNYTCRYSLCRRFFIIAQKDFRDSFKTVEQFMFSSSIIPDKKNYQASIPGSFWVEYAWNWIFCFLKLTSLPNTSGVCVPCLVVSRIQAVLPDFETFKHWQRHNWPRSCVLLLGIITVIVIVMICTMRQFHKSSVYEMCDFLHLRIHKVCTHPSHVTFNLRNPCQT